MTETPDPEAGESDPAGEAGLVGGGAGGGGGGGTNSVKGDMARADRTPTTAEKKEIADHLSRGERQEAIDKTIQYYGIDTSNVNGKVTYDPSLTTADAATRPDRTIRIGPSTFSGRSDGFLGTTIMHEVTHANQVANHGWPQNSQQVAAYETMGYETGVDYAGHFGLTTSEKGFYTNSRASNYGNMSKPNQAIYDGGQYWGMK